MPVLIFFSAIVNIFYYVGLVQYCLIKFGWMLHFLMRTSPIESANSVATVILGPVGQNKSLIEVTINITIYTDLTRNVLYFYK